jgi:hypothetical protein
MVRDDMYLWMNLFLYKYKLDDSSIDGTKHSELIFVGRGYLYSAATNPTKEFKET